MLNTPLRTAIIRGPVLARDGHGWITATVVFQRDRRWMVSDSEEGSIKLFDLRQSNKPGVCYQSLEYGGGNKCPVNRSGSVKIWDLWLVGQAGEENNNGCRAGVHTESS
mmetsp:Transcript_3936/g.4275  ORF Transcript_3936/g.4275 Transcript_3936/m.4275 type:complete len:109 (-) Transcript_3936:113-439(-)